MPVATEELCSGSDQDAKAAERQGLKNSQERWLVKHGGGASQPGAWEAKTQEDKVPQAQGPGTEVGTLKIEKRTGCHRDTQDFLLNHKPEQQESPHPLPVFNSMNSFPPSRGHPALSAAKERDGMCGAGESPCPPLH